MDFSASVVSSAFQPGAVLGEVDYGLQNVISDLDDLARGEVAGYNASVKGRYRKLFPRLSREDYAVLRLQDLPEVPHVLEDMVQRVVGVTADARAALTSTRKVVRQEMVDGTCRYIVVPRVPRAAPELDILEAESVGAAVAGGLVGVEDPEELAARSRKRKYTLSQLFTDADVLPKYNLSVRTVETAKRTAATDAVAAAAIFQRAMNAAQTDTAVTITAGDFTTNKVQARNAIRQICRSAPRTDVAVFSYVMMDTLFMFGPEGERDWYVSGPLKAATEISYVYWFVRQQGWIDTSILLSLELVLLRIDISDGNSPEEPRLQYHAAVEGMPPLAGMPRSLSANLSAEGRIAVEEVGRRLLPVLDAGGAQLATAVRVTDRYVLVNSHVVDADSSCTVGGQLVEVKSQLSRDLWSAKCDGEAEPWVLRDPVVGERVIICYLADGELSCSEPLQVVSVDQHCVVTSIDASVSYGTSGGALVSMEDFALLGVHSASTKRNLISYRFGNRQFADLLDSDSVTAFSRHDEVGSFAERMVSHYQRRGVYPIFKSAVHALQPVYVDQLHVGMAVENGGRIYTLCDPDCGLRVGAERKPLVFTREVGTALCSTVDDAQSRVAPTYRRPPNYHEKVFVLGCDSEPYMSGQTTVQSIGLNSKTFVIGDLQSLDKPVTGGLVMAMDGAVLGVCGPRSTTTAVGLGYKCWFLDREPVREVRNFRDALSVSFPFLNLAAWSDMLLEEVFTHSSVGVYSNQSVFNAGMRPLANIGDNVAKAELYKRLREDLVPHPQWALVMQATQSNAALAQAAWDCKFADLLRVGAGTTMARTSKAYADLTEALIGAAYVVENSSVVSHLCKVLGVLGTEMTEPITPGAVD